MPAEREPALEVPLHGKRVRAHEPRAVLILRAQQERDAFAVRRIGRRNAGDVQRVERKAGRVGVRIRSGELRPAAAGFLPIANRLDRLRDAGLRRAWSTRDPSDASRVPRPTSAPRRAATAAPGAGSRSISVWRPGSGYAVNPPAAIAVWLMTLYSERRAVEAVAEPAAVGHLPREHPVRHRRRHRSSGCPSAASASCV